MKSHTQGAIDPLDPIDVQGERAFIGGRWVGAQSTVSIPVTNPATGATLQTVRYASAEQVEQAIESAHQALSSPAWRRLDGLQRSALLHELTDVLEQHRDELLHLVVAEVGTPVTAAGALQVDSAISTFRWFAEAARRGPDGAYEWGLPFTADAPGVASLLTREPAGVVAAITAYNYPLLLLARKLGGVLASGCTAVLMPSEQSPLSTLRFFELFAEAGYPPGVANLIIGGREAGTQLTTDPRVDLVSFTGSVEVGGRIMQQASSSIKRVVLELGGKSPSIVLPGADLSTVVPQSTLRWTANAGQGCGCTTRTFVPRASLEEFIDQASHFIAEMRVGDPTHPDTTMGPLISAPHRSFVEGSVDAAVATGGTIAAGGGRPTTEDGFFMNPVLLSDVGNDASVAQTELFGPVGIVMAYDEIDDAIAAANDTKFALNAAIFGPTEPALAVARAIRSGTVSINAGSPFPRADAPWGGPGLSGIGREGGDEGFREFFELKHIQYRLG